LDYIDGVPVDRFVEEHALPLRGILELFLKVCEAVAYAHRNLVVHRDLKPSNILVTADSNPHLLDFGIAKLLAPDQSVSLTTASAQRPWGDFNGARERAEQAVRRAMELVDRAPKVPNRLVLVAALAEAYRNLPEPDKLHDQRLPEALRILNDVGGGEKGLRVEEKVVAGWGVSLQARTWISVTSCRPRGPLPFSVDCLGRIPGTSSFSTNCNGNCTTSESTVTAIETLKRQLPFSRNPFVSARD
jgi:serine/threonine protein kinase